MPGTINVRMSAVGTFGPSWRMPPAPEGTLDQADRQEIVGTYAGIAAGGDVSGAIVFAGSSAFDLAGSVTTASSIAFSGAGSFALAGTATAFGSVAFAGAGDFTLAGTATALGAVAFAGSGDFLLAGAVSLSGAVAFAGQGDFALVGLASRAGAVAFSGGPGDFALAGTAEGDGSTVLTDSEAATKDWTILLDAKARLEDTGQFDGVYLSDPSEDPGIGSSEAAIAILSLQENDEEGYQDDLQARLTKWTLTLAVRAREPAVRDKKASRLYAVAKDALDHKSLAGLTYNDWTVLRRARWEKPKDAERRLTVAGEWGYSLDDSEDP